ncbi:TetR/AcrR family transcriptional regulator [Streptomyces lincolnensis]|uniref:TetR/AcrR family transcriptional regulator n=1 Tax=Streptomyces lincolnensis TaxID=1915 RepID=UPI001E36583B|nr:TetR/AcrR family transcriptional regulator [Streptomyces lincolnensis]MCD7443755.1 TetR/AcrR family transcriptional regulator [Streptomyces lincolnensis]
MKSKPATASASAPAPTRTRLLDAAHDLMLTVGLARATTKEIAKAAGCSEAALYKHFDSKEDLFIGVLSERLPRLAPLLHDLAAEPGRHSLEENLTEIARQAALFYEQSFPIAASLYAETQLKRRHDEVMRERGAGPHKPIEWLDAYLRAEQSAGRVAPDADTFAAASLLLGACAQRAFAYDAQDGERPPVEEFATRLARTLLGGISVAGKST